MTDRGYTHSHTNLERLITHRTCFYPTKMHTLGECANSTDKLEMEVITLCPAGVGPSAVMCGPSGLTSDCSISGHCGIPVKLFQMCACCGQIHTSTSTTALIPKPKNFKEVSDFTSIGNIKTDIFIYIPLYFLLSVSFSLIFDLTVYSSCSSSFILSTFKCDILAFNLKG